PADAGTPSAFRILAHDRGLCDESPGDACTGDAGPDPVVPAFQCAECGDDADAAGRRLLRPLQIRLRLHPLLAAFLTAAVLRPYPCIRAPARRRRRVSSAEG